MPTLDYTEIVTPQHLTLLFKHGKSTTVLSVLPSQSLSEVKSRLLNVLASRNTNTLPNTDIPLPDDSQQLEFGVLLDKRDISKGWVFAEDRSTLAQAVASSSKKKNAAKKDGPITTFEDLDLKDGAWVAYRLRSDALTAIDEGADDMDMQDDPGWNVIAPSYDDDADDAEDMVGQDDEMDIPIPAPRNNISR